MVSSTTRKIISLVISLLIVVISLTGVAFGAFPTPDLTKQTRYPLGSTGEPGKMVRDNAGSFYVTDFWGKGIVKLNKMGERIGFISTNGRPSAVAVLPDSRLVVAISKPTPKLAFYSQTTGEEITATPFGTPADPLFNPTGIAVDPVAGYIYVLDSGDAGSTPVTSNFGRVRVYSFSGEYKYVFGSRTPIGTLGSSAAAGSFKKPMGIAYEKVSGNIVVADTMNQRLQFFRNYTAVSPCAHVKSVGNPAGDGTVGTKPVDNNTAVVRFGAPADIAFEYDATETVLNRIYVTERGRGEVVAIRASNNYSVKRISASTFSPAEHIQFPSGILFEKTGTGTSGILYISNEARGTKTANILALGIDGGTIPAQSGTMTMNTVDAITASSPLTVTGTASTAVTCRVNGGTGIPASGNWSVSLTLTPGMNYILCQSAGGLYKEANTYFGTAATAPTVAITTPAAGLYTNSSSVTVSGTTTPGNAIVQLANSLGETVTILSDAAGNWSKDVSLSAGSNLLTATAWKDGTETSSPALVTVVADFTPPTIEVSFLINDAITNNAIQNIDGIVTDANLLAIEVNGEAVPAKAIVALNASSTYFSTPVILNRGENILTIKATDRVGQSLTIKRGMSGTTEAPIILKPENPGMTVALPADNSYRTAPGVVTASGTVDAVFNSVNACGTTVTPSGGAWSTPSMNITNGFLSCQFTASVGVDTVTEKRTINTGASFEQVAITSPATDLATDASSVIISGNVPSANSAPQISINEATPINVSTYADGAFSHTVTLAAGLNSVKIIANGGTTTAVRNIILDTDPPGLTLQADSKSMPVMIYGSIEPSAKMSAITASLGATNVPILVSDVITFVPLTYDQSGSVSWSANLNGYTYDKISFTAIDPAGNSTVLPYVQGIPAGDIDGDGVVRLADALAALRHVAGTERIDHLSNDIEVKRKFFQGDVGGLINGRVSRDGIIDITDSVLILNKAYGLLTF